VETLWSLFNRLDSDDGNVIACKQKPEHGINWEDEGVPPGIPQSFGPEPYVVKIFILMEGKSLSPSDGARTKQPR
jgi:hypothetical protein